MNCILEQQVVKARRQVMLIVAKLQPKYVLQSHLHGPCSRSRVCEASRIDQWALVVQVVSDQVVFSSRSLDLNKANLRFRKPSWSHSRQPQNLLAATVWRQAQHHQQKARTGKHVVRMSREHLIKDMGSRIVPQGKASWISAFKWW